MHWNIRVIAMTSINDYFFDFELFVADGVRKRESKVEWMKKKMWSAKSIMLTFRFIAS